MYSKFEFNSSALDGKIYRIYSKRLPNMQYIGSTTQSLKKRFSVHRSKPNKLVSKLMSKYDDVIIELIETFPCLNMNELHYREQYYIDDARKKYGIILNIACAAWCKTDKTPLCLIEWYIEQYPEYTTMLNYIMLRDY